MAHYAIPVRTHQRQDATVRSVRRSTPSVTRREGRLSWGVFVGLLVSAPVWAVAAAIALWLL